MTSSNGTQLEINEKTTKINQWA